MKRLVKILLFAFILNSLSSITMATYGYRHNYDYDYPYVYDAYWNNRTARWDVNGHADKYEVTLYKDGRRIATEITYSRSYSFSSFMYSRGYNYYFEVRPYNYRTGWGSWVSSNSFYYDDYCREYAYRDYRYDRDYRDRYGVSYARNPGPPYDSQTYNSNGFYISNNGLPTTNSNNQTNVQGVNVPEPQVINDTINGFFPTGSFINVYGTWKYAYINGAFATNTWIKSNGKWYYIDINGNMVTGLYAINGKTYYLNADGSMATGIINVAGANHYFDANGEMQY